MGRGGTTTTSTSSARSRTEARRREVEAKLASYRLEIRKVPNAILVDKAAGEILGATILESRGRDDLGYADGCAMACLDEATRRGNTDLYRRAFNNALLSQGHGERAKKFSTPLHVGEPSMAVGGLGDGAFHLIDEDERKQTLCRLVIDITDPLHLRRDEINSGFVCTSCLAAEEERFQKLREAAGTPRPQSD